MTRGNHSTNRSVMREVPEVQFYFKRGLDGRWVLDYEAVSPIQ